MSSAQHTLRSLRLEQQKIVQLIAKINEQLGRIEKEELSPNQPYVSLRRVKSVKELRGEHKNLQEALREDLKMLRRQLKQVRADQTAMRRSVVRQHIAASKARLKSFIETMVKDGVVDATELAKAQNMADQILNKSVGLMNSNPTTENIRGTLESLADTQMLGADPDKGASATALNALSDAAKKRRAKFERQFRRSPTSRNFAEMLDAEGLAQSLGAEGSSDQTGWKPVGNKNHTTGPRETLSGLSMQYYGSFEFWDKIYVENFGVIGQNPDKLPSGINLTIP